MPFSPDASPALSESALRADIHHTNKSPVLIRRTNPATIAPQGLDWRAVASAMACLALAACGGGGGSGGVQSVSAEPPPPPPAPPPPPPPPPPVNFDTAEFRRSDGPGFHGADDAWRAGATGAGELIAVIDTGIDSDSPEFAGRIDPASRDVAGNRDIDPDNDHGTNVALVAAGARNNEGLVGIAFDANVLALRSDMPGSCGTDTPQDASQGCLFSDGAIAAGIDAAIEGDATVINLSLGGGTASTQLRDAVARAADAGIVVVIAAGNGGDGSDPDIDPDQPDPFATSLLEVGGKNVIIVGSVDDRGDLSAFSNRAGEFGHAYISARGERVCCVHADGEIFIEEVGGQQFITLFSGTSFAAPQVAGAVALLAQAFPNLTGEEIVEILLTSARDAGADGIDAQFGSGILDIARAFQPQGTTMLAGTQKALGFGDDFAIGSPAMGDALTNASISTTITDSYDRAFTLNLAAQSRNAAPMQRLRGAVERRGIAHAASGENLSVAVTISERDRAGGLGWTQPLQSTPDDAREARVLSGRIAARVAQDTKIGFGVAQSADGLVAQMRGGKAPAFRIAPQAGQDAVLSQSSELAFAVRQELGPWGLSVSGERGQAWLGDDLRSAELQQPGLRRDRPTSRLSLAADRRWDSSDASLSLTWLSERDTVLGAAFNPVFGIGGSESVLLDGSFAHRVGRSWRFGAAMRAGMTTLWDGTQLGQGSRLFTHSWSVDVSRKGLFQSNDQIGFRLSQPLRVSAGSVHFDLPTGYDYASETPIITRQSLSLTPKGREIIGELNWSGEIAGAQLSTSLYYRNDPGHFQGASSDAGALVTLWMQF